MTDRAEPSLDAAAPAEMRRFAAIRAPFVRAPERARTLFLVTLGAACGPLLAGVALFGYHAAMVAALSVTGCIVAEQLYYRVTRAPALLGRSHACLTGVLLALTLPAFVPWYVPLVAAAFAIIVAKAVFGGVGHFLWQPALVGRLAVAVLFPVALTMPFPSHRNAWPVLARDKLLTGDVMNVRRVQNYKGWQKTPAPPGADALLLNQPTTILNGLMKPADPAFSALANMPSGPDAVPGAKPTALSQLPPISDLLYGGRPGSLGETCAVVIVIAGLYLVYRNYVKWQLPLAFLASACCVLAIAPICLAGPNQVTKTVWYPLVAEGLDVGFVYVSYQILSCELLLAAFFFATEMTSRPVTTGGQVIFGLGCGALAMLLKLYLDVPVPCFMAVLAMNTLTPAIDSIWRPRVFGCGWIRRRQPG